MDNTNDIEHNQQDATKKEQSEQFLHRKTSRHSARELMIQALYQWKINYDIGNAVILNYQQIKHDLAEFDTYKTANLKFVKELCDNIFDNVNDLLAILENVLDRDFKELSPVEGSVILLAAYELKFCAETPTLVIINEAIELVKKFGSSEGYKYVNVIVELLAKNIRKDENIVSPKHRIKTKHRTKIDNSTENNHSK